MYFETKSSRPTQLRTEHVYSRQFTNESASVQLEQLLKVFAGLWNASARI
jgi:hypothetical protein